MYKVQNNVVSESPWLPMVDFAAGLWILSFALSILFNSKFVDPARKKKPFSADKGEQLVRRSSNLVTVYHTLLIGKMQSIFTPA